jgi:hypothetical protein
MIFLSYAREDRDAARQLESDLAASGFSVTKDQPQPESNPCWRTAILPLMRRARVMVVLWSREAAASPWVEQETRAFEGARIWFATDAEPPRVSREEESVVRDWDGLKVAASSLDRKGRSHKVRDGIRGEPWRRRALVTAGQATLRGLRRRKRPARRLLDAGHDVLTLEDFDMTFRRLDGDVWMAVEPVTCRQYARILADGDMPVHPSIDLAVEREDLPVASVSWYEAMASAEWLGGTLPSENQWQVAAEGSQRLPYATATGALRHDLAWFGRRFGTSNPRPASAYPPNPSGFYGLCGNTWDWCSTKWRSHRVIRGGSWMDRSRFCTVTARYRNAPMDRDCTVGFRVCIRARRVRPGHYVMR